MMIFGIPCCFLSGDTSNDLSNSFRAGFPAKALNAFFPLSLISVPYIVYSLIMYALLIEQYPLIENAELFKLMLS